MQVISKSTVATVNYQFLVDSYEVERFKVLNAWSMFRDEDMPVRPHSSDPRGRSVREQMVHQCVSEDLWFRTMLDIEVGASPLPDREERIEFIRRYATDSGKRLRALNAIDEPWWQVIVPFFDVENSRAWVMTRRLTHTAHHRGQLIAMLRMLGRDLHSTYGPTADTGGLMQHKAPTVHAYSDVDALLEGETAGGAKATLPTSGNLPVTERPGD